MIWLVLFPLGYVDPGAGALLLQWVLAGVFGILLFFRRKVWSFFSRKKQNEVDDSDVKGQD